MKENEYTLERLDDDGEYVTCQGEDGPIALPLSRCKILQQGFPWERKDPDIILIRIPDDLANKFRLP